jgi:alpha-beta hydrolase superfamily lysophospholipase
MVRVFKSVSTLCAAILAVAMLMTGCGSKSSSEASGINPAALLADIVKSVQQPITRALGGWDWDSFINAGNGFGTLLINFRYTLDMKKVTYQSTGADGKAHSMTGLLILPEAILGGKPSVPILMYQHGTEVYRPFSPSQYLAHQDRPTDYPEVMVAAAIAATGYAVALVDYEGMGDNTDPQPHVVGAVLAQQVIDLLKASRDIIGNSSSPCTWNSQLFLMGYSEGGYVTMEVTRELQINPAPGFTVTASAPLSGPHDLSGVMRGVILADSTFKAPYFVPMLLTSYNYAYGTLFSPDSAMVSPYNNTLPPLFDGNSQSDSINEEMGMTYSPVKLIMPKIILTQQFIGQLTLDTSPVVGFLRQNDSYRGWTPTVPMRMIHHKKDDLVPYGNSQVAYDAFIAAGATSVELVPNTLVINISSSPVKTVHFGSAFPELIDGWRWLDGFKQ